MKDCNGNAIDIGDVVEVVKPDPRIDDTGHATVIGNDERDGEVLAQSERQYEGRAEWLGWYPTEQLRLVRKKEAP